jgi:type II secretion system protein N
LKDLELTELQISPVWHKLFSDDKKVNLTGMLAAGKIDADAPKSGQINFKFEDIPLAELQQAGMPYRISGKMSGQLAGENISEQMRGRGNFSLNLEGAQIFGLEKIGLPASFSAGTLRLQGRFDQRRFSLEKVVLTGGSLELTGGGNILIGESSEQTRLNLNVGLQPTAITPDSLLQLFNKL